MRNKKEEKFRIICTETANTKRYHIEQLRRFLFWEYWEKFEAYRGQDYNDESIFESVSFDTQDEAEKYVERNFGPSAKSVVKEITI